MSYKCFVSVIWFLSYYLSQVYIHMSYPPYPVATIKGCSVNCSFHIILESVLRSSPTIPLSDSLSGYIMFVWSNAFLYVWSYPSRILLIISDIFWDHRMKDFYLPRIARMSQPHSTIYVLVSDIIVDVHYRKLVSHFTSFPLNLNLCVIFDLFLHSSSSRYFASEYSGPDISFY